MKNMAKNIEIEHRARFSLKKYSDLGRFLKSKAKDLGANDQRVWFFVMPDKLLKVTHNMTKGNGKLTLKLTKIGKGNHFKEIEFPIDEKNIEKAVEMFNALGYKCLYEPKILRHNYMYKGVELALKYSKTWGYHLELEVLVNSLKDKPKAEEKINLVAAELRIHVMAEKELWKFTQNIEKTYKNPK
ncbi:MAG TPA: CYTH domain-containing protein [Candidatus Paceibacterota bacterium]